MNNNDDDQIARVPDVSLLFQTANDSQPASEMQPRTTQKTNRIASSYCHHVRRILVTRVVPKMKMPFKHRCSKEGAYLKHVFIVYGSHDHLHLKNAI